MIYLRSVIFHCLFTLANIVLCLFFVWVLVLPRRWAWVVLRYGYFGAIYYLEKIILGLNYVVEGQENLPAVGPYIVAMKHQSAYETLKIFHLFGDVRIILKRELLWLPLWGWYAAKIGMIAVDRGKRGAMESVLRNAAPVVAQRHSILIYPQGTRVSVDDTVAERPYKSGVIRLYSHFKLPIVPVAMNAGKFWPRRSFLIKPGTVTFRILPAIPAGLPAEEAFQTLQLVLEEESRKLL